MIQVYVYDYKNFRKPPDPARPDYCFKSDKNGNRNIVRQEVPVLKKSINLRNKINQWQIS